MMLNIAHPASVLMTSLPIAKEFVSAGAFASAPATRRFHVALATAVLATVLSGFGFSVHSRLANGPLPMRAVVHGTLFLSWVVIFAVQITLIAAGRVRAHRALGIGAGVLALVMVLSAQPLAIDAESDGVLQGD